jgi:lipid II:glycine glycyltransferase (peptidoglycan interpeptide bridge formation enzyme)
VNVDVKPKKIRALFPTDIFFQTTYWGRVKSHLGWKPVAFDFNSSTGLQGDVMILIKTLKRDFAAAYVPQGPELGPDPEKYGLFLESLSQELTKYIDSTVAFIRYDLPWVSPYAVDATDGRTWPGHPAPELRELRMNIGTRTWPLRKAPIDLTVADALVIDLVRTEEAIFKDMKPKTRYNIRLAQRKGISVFNASVEMLPLFYKLYLQTAKRNGFLPGSYRHFSALFSPVDHKPGSSEVLFLLAARGQDVLAGAIIAISGRQAIYLYGASSNEQRNQMGSYALHWEAIKLARQKGCLTYDMGSVSPVSDPGHPFYGMYRFKTGFGGKIVHRNGTWDYPVNRRGYRAFRNYETSFNMTLPK